MPHYIFQTSTAIGIIIAIILLLSTESGQQIFITILTTIIGSIFWIITAPFVALLTVLAMLLGVDMDRAKKIYDEKQNKRY